MIERAIRVWTRMTSEVRRWRVLQEREIFFDRITQVLSNPYNVADHKFGQDLLLDQTKITERIVEIDASVFYLTTQSIYEQREGTHSYSLFLAGDLLRIGLLLMDGLENAPITDWQNELNKLWPGCIPEQFDRQGSTMYEWTFLVPDLYTSYETQERYILGMRHMHCRVLRVISDYRVIQAQEARKNQGLIDEMGNTQRWV